MFIVSLFYMWSDFLAAALMYESVSREKSWHKSGDCCSHLLVEPVYLSVVTCTTLVPKQVEGIVWSQMLFDLSIAVSLGNDSVCT